MIFGAGAGAVLGIGVPALAASRLIDGGVITEGGTALLVVGEGAMHLLIAVAAAIGGALLGAVGYAVGREADPESPLLAPAPMIAVGTVVGAIVGFAAARAGLGLAADISAEVVTVSVFRAALVALVAGALTGAVVGGTVERLARPETLALGGEAWPSRLSFLRDAVTAVGLPLLAVVAGGLLVTGFARILLDASHEAALVLFGGIGAAILFGAAVIAANPPRRDDGGR
jgi:hypothetical protein